MDLKQPGASESRTYNKNNKKPHYICLHFCCILSFCIFLFLLFYDFMFMLLFGHLRFFGFVWVVVIDPGWAFLCRCLLSLRAGPPPPKKPTWAKWVPSHSPTSPHFHFAPFLLVILHHKFIKGLEDSRDCRENSSDTLMKNTATQMCAGQHSLVLCEFFGQNTAK